MLRRGLLSLFLTAALAAQALGLTPGQKFAISGRSIPASALPSGATGVWYFDQYQASPRRLIPNTISPTVSQDLITAPRDLFANTWFWVCSGASAVCTDSGLAGPDGHNDASTFVAPGNYFLDLNAAFPYPVLPAGTYTLAIWAKANSGSTQPFCMSFFTAGSTSSQQTATTSWQRFTFTATVTAGAQRLMPIKSCDGSTGANLQIDAAELFAGSSDLGVGPSSAIYIGPNQYDATTVCGSGFCNFNAAQAYGLIQFPSDQATTTYTSIAVVKKVATGGAAHQAYLSATNNFGYLTSYTEQSSLPVTIFGGATFTQPSTTGGGTPNSTGLWDLFYDSGWWIVGNEYDGTQGSVFLDDQLIMNNVGTVTTSDTWRNLWVGEVNGLDLNANYEIAAIAYWPRALSNAEREQAYTYLAAHVKTASGITVNTLRSLIAEGDSNTQGFDSADAGYPYLYGPVASPKVAGGVWAVDSTGLTDVEARDVALRAGMPASVAGRKLIITFLPGNQLSTWSGGASAYATEMFAEMARDQAAGFITCCATTLPRTAGADSGFAAARAILDPLTRAQAGLACNFIIDFAANATIGTDADAGNTTYFNGGLHLTAAGQAIAEGIYQTAVNAQ